MNRVTFFLLIVFSVFNFFVPGCKRSNNSVDHGNYIELTSIEKTDTVGLYRVHFQLSTTTIAADIRYDRNPGIAGVAVGIFSPKGTRGVTDIGMADFRKNDAATPDLLLLIPLNEKVFFERDAQIPLFQSITENGEIRVASLRAK